MKRIVSNEDRFLSGSAFGSQRGYTLIELLVVIAIIGILSGIAYLGLSGGTGREQTRAASLEVKGTVRSVQEQALTSKLNSAGQPADFYGIRFINQVTGSNPPRWQGWEVIRIERCENLLTAVTISQHTLPTSVVITTSPTNIISITFKKSKATTKFFDSSGSEVDNPSVTVTASGTGTYNVTVFKDTGRIE